MDPCFSILEGFIVSESVKVHIDFDNTFLIGKLYRKIYFKKFCSTRALKAPNPFGRVNDECKKTVTMLDRSIGS